jgi:YidC/Oxa1 family membrane protein insertase
MLEPNIFNIIFVFPILNLLVLLYKGFLLVKLPGAFGFAIIGLTAIIRGLFQPFFKKQMETAKKMAELKPKIDNLSKLHKGDQKKIQQEQLKLYQEAGINPASGCLFMIIQIPVFIALYNTLSLFLTNGQGAKSIAAINKVLYSSALKINSLDPWFFSINLTVSPKASGNWIYLLVPVITGLLQYFQAQATMPQATPIAAENAAEKELMKNDDKKKDSSEDFQKAMNTQMKFLFPVMIGWFSYTLPIGLSLYWNIFSLFSIVQYQQSKIKNSK